MSAAHVPGQRGVSLVEALVALAVMAFGVLGVIGVQITLRLNADVAKQRAEAVRFAQQAIESWRDYSALAPPVPLPAPPPKTYADVQSLPASAVAGVTNTNTIFTITSAVVPVGTPPIKSLQVDVTWDDRNGTQQRVTLFSNIAGILPETAGSVALAAKSATNQQVLGRNGNIPVNAVDNGNGTSSFTPPGGSGVVWVFNNTTGLITTCPTCGTTGATLLTGFIRFSLGASNTIPLPTSMTQVQVNRGVTAPTVAATPDACFTDVYDTTALVYNCAVPLPIAPPFQWSGWSQIVGTLPIAPTMADVSANDYKVCRYTPAASNAVTVPNVQHPMNYVSVATSLTNQNFLVILAGDNTNAFDCEIPGTTLRHQPF